MEIPKNEKRLLSPNKIVIPTATNENGILDEYIQTNDQNCLEIFTCTICTCLAWDPVCCPKCDKPYCRGCIIKYGKNKPCPYGCNNDTFREITRNEKNFLNKIKIKCTNVGCSKYIQYSDYVTHLEQCNLRKYHCKNLPCKEEGYINDMLNHSKKCPYRLIECLGCKQLIKYCDIKIHKTEQCPEKMIKCNLCGSSMKRSVYLKVKISKYTERKTRADFNEYIEFISSFYEEVKGYNQTLALKLGFELFSAFLEAKKYHKCIPLLSDMKKILKKDLLKGSSMNNGIHYYLAIACRIGYIGILLNDKASIQSAINPLNLTDRAHTHRYVIILSVDYDRRVQRVKKIKKAIELKGNDYNNKTINELYKAYRFTLANLEISLEQKTQLDIIPLSS